LEKLEDVVDGRQKDVLSLAMATPSSRHVLDEGSNGERLDLERFEMFDENRGKICGVLVLVQSSVCHETTREF